ncbi:MAG: preprotein translocase subunit SecE [Gammaproteobacteria bacterium]
MTDIKPDIKTHANPLDVVKLGIAVLLIIFGAGQFYYYGSHPLVYGGVVYQVPAAIRLLVLLVALALAVTSARLSSIGASAWHYLMSARTEVQRMVWPNRAQTIQATVAVIMLVVVAGLFMWVIDLIVQTGLGRLTGSQ